MIRVRSFLDQFPQKIFEPGETLLKPGENPGFGYIIIEGTVKVFMRDRQGIERRVMPAMQYEIIPSGWLSNPRMSIQYQYDAYSIVKAAEITADSFERAALENPSVLYDLFLAGDSRIKELKNRIMTLVQSRAEDKLVYFFYGLLERGTEPAKDGWARIIYSMSQQEIADALGMARETAAASIQKLIDQKIIRSTSRTRYEVHLDNMCDYHLEHLLYVEPGKPRPKRQKNSSITVVKKK